MSFHGNLDTLNPSDAKNIKAKVLVLRGANDLLVPKEQVKVFETQMQQANVKWQVVGSPGSVHGFTNPQSGNDRSKAVAENEDAEERSCSFLRKSFNISEFYIILPTDGGISQNYILER